MTNNKPVPLIFLDTETTGLQPDIHTPWEIGWVTAVHDPVDDLLLIVDRYQATVPLSYQEGMRADDKALEIGGHSRRGHVNLREREGVVYDLKSALQKVSAFAYTEDVPHFVGAVPGFDHAMLCMNWLGWPGFGKGLWHYHLIDVENLAAGVLRLPPPWSADDLTERMGLTPRGDEKHTAYGDAVWAMDMYAAVYRLNQREWGGAQP